MGYRDDFYIVDFIIGYTGVLHKSPSVYFFDPAKNAFGHITQHHEVANNIGRGVNADGETVYETVSLYLLHRDDEGWRISLFSPYSVGNTLRIASDR